MRVLFSGGLGMPAVLRLVLLARAMQAAGNEVRFCCPARARHRVVRAGLVPVLAGPRQFGRAWRPDLVVHDPLCPDSAAMAAESGVPTIGYLPYARPPLSPRPTVWIDPCPPPLRERPEPGAWQVRCDAWELPGRPAPRLPALALTPRVCVTGAPAGSRPEDRRRARLFRRVAEGVESLGLQLLELTGDDHPWSLLLPGCVAVVHGGDEGVVYAAARFGVSQLVLPAGEDERRAGARLEQAGIGRCLSDDELAGDPSMLRLRFHVAELVNGGRALPEAVRLGLAVARMPQPADLVADIEALVR
ncbi:glycosyltransferase [Streptomyces sp. NRRL S-340]|uniref:glycosyltransferase n=1 Tax=Streptomyces sp. NRRL S-340 TaxID=1463901 RepID=UPI000564D4A1|nr:nucleotide disphospho-sugar-binding domain-containing protein [Streptomyces sp. NRRL S-340]